MEQQKFIDMKVQRQSKRGEALDAHLFLIYDEKETIDETIGDKARIENMPIPSGCSPEEFRQRVLDTSLKFSAILYRSAFGHPHLCYFTIHKDKITFEFDADRQYSGTELKQIMRLANSAKKRCKFSM